MNRSAENKGINKKMTSSEIDAENDPTKYTNSFEFGPAWWIHLPMHLFGVLGAIRTGYLGFFAAANPGMENGGLYAYSKNAILKGISAHNQPKVALFKVPNTEDHLQQIAAELGVSIPFVLKPDSGERGKDVFIIRERNQLNEYLKKVDAGQYLLQEYISEKQEFGVFYIKEPQSSKVSITSLTKKISMQVEGDAVSTIEHLLKIHPRAHRYTEFIRKGVDLNSIPNKGQIVKLSSIGNHCRGTMFLDYSFKIDLGLEQSFAKLCENVEGFYYGRLDVMVEKVEDLWQPDKITIIEINGTNSEPAHIYSPGISYWAAIGVVFDHFNRLTNIASQNMKAGRRGVPFKELWASYKNFRKTNKR
jgi:hypothetical protein